MAHQDVGLAVLLVVADEVSRWGLAGMLASIPKVHTTQACADVPEAVRCFPERPYDVVIVDSCLAAQIPALAEAVGRHDTKVLLLLQDLDDDTLRTAAGLKLDGFLTGPGLTLRGLGEAMTRLQHGEMSLPAEVAHQMMAVLSRPRSVERPPVTLTPREHQTLQLLGEGLSNKQIAARLRISQHGTKRYVASILAKLNCPNRTLAVAYALRTGLLEDSLAS
ncbi:response regulator transcription factor [Streptomyces gamaensis]|uniref:Response regulator transcription factor n=1 Tax=Streptomyces gamaensis TaxID=1763542 RepID=A0ABW0YQX7_9ACTN